MSAHTFDKLVEIEKASIYRSGERAPEGVELRAVLNVAERLIVDSNSLWSAYEEMGIDETRYTIEGYEFNRHTVAEAYREIILLTPDVFKSWQRALKIAFGKEYKNEQ